MTPLQIAIVTELSQALAKLKAPPALRGIVGAWGDTLSEDEVCKLLKEWNATGKVTFDSIPPVH